MAGIAKNENAAGLFFQTFQEKSTLIVAFECYPIISQML